MDLRRPGLGLRGRGPSRPRGPPHPQPPGLGRRHRYLARERTQTHRRRQIPSHAAPSHRPRLAAAQRRRRGRGGGGRRPRAPDSDHVGICLPASPHRRPARGAPRAVHSPIHGPGHPRAAAQNAFRIRTEDRSEIGRHHRRRHARVVPYAKFKGGDRRRWRRHPAPAGL